MFSQPHHTVSCNANTKAVKLEGSQCGTYPDKVLNAVFMLTISFDSRNGSKTSKCAYPKWYLSVPLLSSVRSDCSKTHFNSKTHINIKEMKWFFTPAILSKTRRYIKQVCMWWLCILLPNICGIKWITGLFWGWLCICKKKSTYQATLSANLETRLWGCIEFKDCVSVAMGVKNPVRHVH